MTNVKLVKARNLNYNKAVEKGGVYRLQEDSRKKKAFNNLKSTFNGDSGMSQFRGEPKQAILHIVNNCSLRCYPGGRCELHELTLAALDWFRQLNIVV